MAECSYHVAVSISGPLTDADIDALCALDYVGHLDSPAVFSRFVDAADMGAAITAAVAQVESALTAALVVSATIMTEDYWDATEADEAARLAWLRTNSFKNG